MALLNLQNTHTLFSSPNIEQKKHTIKQLRIIYIILSNKKAFYSQYKGYS